MEKAQEKKVVRFIRKAIETLHWVRWDIALDAADALCSNEHYLGRTPQRLRLICNETRAGRHDWTALQSNPNATGRHVVSSETQSTARAERAVIAERGLAALRALLDKAAMA